MDAAILGLFLRGAKNADWSTFTYVTWKLLGEKLLENKYHVYKSISMGRNAHSSEAYDECEPDE